MTENINEKANSLARFCVAAMAAKLKPGAVWLFVRLYSASDGRARCWTPINKIRGAKERSSDFLRAASEQLFDSGFLLKLSDDPKGEGYQLVANPRVVPSRGAASDLGDARKSGVKAAVRKSDVTGTG